jgi:putative transposase
VPRTARIAPGDVVFHVLNRANARAQIFGSDQDYLAFERILAETCDRTPMRILAYCVMPDHWHLVLWPWKDGDLGTFMQRATTTHARRWHLRHDSVGCGHLYQGPYKSFPIQQDRHFLTVCRYVERNPLRAKLVARAEQWPWSSLWRRENLHATTGKPPLWDWPVERPADWLEMVSEPMTQAELDALRTSAKRGRPFGTIAWRARTAEQLGLQSTFRSPGRPRIPRKWG